MERKRRGTKGSGLKADVAGAKGSGWAAAGGLIRGGLGCCRILLGVVGVPVEVGVMV